MPQQFQTKKRSVKAERYSPPALIPKGIKLGSQGERSGEAYIFNDGFYWRVKPGDMVLQIAEGFYFPLPEDIFNLFFEPAASQGPEVLGHVKTGKDGKLDFFSTDPGEGVKQ